MGQFYKNSTYREQDWQDETTMINLMKKGYYNLEFTNMGNNSLPAIAAGSSVDVDGSIAYFASEEAITDPGISDGIVYVTISNSAGTAVANFTNTPRPDYNYDKKGYYGVSGERYVLELYKSSSTYSNKTLIDSRIYKKQVDSIIINSLQRELEPYNGLTQYSIIQQTGFTYSDSDNKFSASPDPGAGYNTTYYGSLTATRQTGWLCFDTVGDTSTLKVCVNGTTNSWRVANSTSEVEQYILPYLDTAEVFTTAPSGSKVGDIYIESGVDVKIGDGTDNTANWFTMSTTLTTAPS
jgi:hypothetical protein